MIPDLVHRVGAKLDRGTHTHSFKGGEFVSIGILILRLLIQSLILETSSFDRILATRMARNSIITIIVYNFSIGATASL